MRDELGIEAAARGLRTLQHIIQDMAEWHFLKAEELIKFKVSSITASLVRSCDIEPTGSHLQGGLS